MGFTLLVTLVGVGGALLGLWLTDAHRRVRIFVPFSAGVLLGVALFSLLPAMVAQIGLPQGLLLFAAGYLLLMGIDRFVYPVCPACAHDHDHESCVTVLHGFAPPLAAATALHAFLDGWGMASADAAGTAGIRLAVPLAVALHKIPEGIALGGMLGAAVHSRLGAFGWAATAQSATLLGAALAFQVAPQLGAAWIPYVLAPAAGCFFYLGFHAIHGEWKPALTGAAGAAVLQQGVRVLFR